MNRILCSTGALIGRPNGRDYTLLKEFAPRLNCDGFEFMMYSTWYDRVEALTEFLKGLNKPICSYHCEKGIGEMITRDGEGETEKALEYFGINCRMAGEIGAKTMVLHLWNGIESDRNIDHNIRVCGRLLEIAAQYGRTLTIENVVCNQKDPMTHLRRLSETYPEIGFTFDTKMAQFHGQLEDIYEEAWGKVCDRIRHMHINDYAGGYKDWTKLRTLHPGEGTVDFDRLFSFVREKGYQGDFTVEATSVRPDGSVDMDALNRDFDRIREYLAVKGKDT